MEINNGPRNFQPRKNQMYQKKFPRQEPRIPNHLDSSNMVEEVIPWCRPYEQFHKKSLVMLQIKSWNMEFPSSVVRKQLQASLIMYTW